MTEPAWLHALRRKAGDRFRELGWPTTRLEEWKYTNLSRLARTEWTEGAAEVPGLEREPLEERIAPAFACNLLVFVNGRFVPGLSAPAPLRVAHGAVSIAETLLKSPELLEPELGRIAPIEEAALAARNTELFVDGAFIHLPEGMKLEQPLRVVHVSAPGSSPTISFPRTLIVAERGAEGTIIEDFVGFGEGTHFTNAVCELVARENVHLDLVRLQREGPSTSHVGTVEVEQHRDSRVRSHTVTLGGDLTRNDLRVRLLDVGAEAGLFGLFVTEGAQHVDNHTQIDHAKPHGTSHELYKGILSGDSRGVFHGRILVRPDAQHTDARQQSKNLLLSPGAEIDTKPQLEIRADDVKCSHGSTIGSLDGDAFFYLRSRGLDAETARGILTRGFASEVIELIPVEALREALADVLVERFAPGREAA